MCILFSAINKHDKYPIIIAANRDESIFRNTISAGYDLFENKKHIFAGKDNLAGGTWLGIDSKLGRFSCVLNVLLASINKENKISRGKLPFLYLLGKENQKAKDVMEELLISKNNIQSKYNGFTLISVKCVKQEKQQFLIGTNSFQQKKDESRIWDISNQKGIHGITNDGNLLCDFNINNQNKYLKHNYWNKVIYGCKLLNDILRLKKTNNGNQCLGNLAETILEKLLHNSQTDSTQVKGNVPIFLPWSNYCTRTSQVIFFEKESNIIHFFSRNYLENNYIKKYEKIHIESINK